MKAEHPAPSVADGGGAGSRALVGLREPAEAKPDAPTSQWPLFALADLFLDGPVGRALLDELHHRFARISRSDVFVAIAMALAVREADLLALEAENRELCARLAARRRAP